MLLSSDLISPVEYSTGDVLSFNLHFEAPANTEAEQFYILGGLYIDTAFIAGSIFGILKAAEVDYGVNDASYMSVWELEPEEDVDLPCQFIINRSDCLLVLFLMRMVGDEADQEADDNLAQIQVQLVAPIPVTENIIPIIIPIVGLALMGIMVTSMSKSMFPAKK